MAETEKKGESKIKVTRKGKAEGGSTPMLYAETARIQARKPGSKIAPEPEEDVEYNKPTGMADNIKTTLEKWTDTLERMGKTDLADTLRKNEKYPSLAKANIVVVYGDAGDVDRIMNADTGEDISGIMKPTYEEAPTPATTVTGGEEGKPDLIPEPGDPDISPATSPGQIDPILRKKMGFALGGLTTPPEGSPLSGLKPATVRVTRMAGTTGEGKPKGDDLAKEKKIKIKDETQKFHGGEVEGGYEGAKLPSRTDDPKPDQELLHKPDERFAKDSGAPSKPGLAKGGQPSEKKDGLATGGEAGLTKKTMTAAQIQKELGVSKPGDIAAVYDVSIRDGKLVSATPNDAETQRFSRIISQTGDKNPPVGSADERNKLSLQYSDKPNVGFASGAGFQAGGEVADTTTEMAEPGGGPPEPAEGEATMKGPFESYAKVEGVDLELVKQGNTLFSNLNEALSGAGAEDPQTYLDELKQFAKDVEAKRSEAVKSMNDTALAASYKDMAADARDLISAFENMIADTGSEEMRAGMPAAAEPVAEPVPEEAQV